MNDQRAPDVQACCRAIAEAFPALCGRPCGYLAEGWDSVACEVGGGLVFRFPRRPDVAAQLEREARLLPALAPALPVPIPVFSHVAPRGGLADLPFAGYPRLRGVSLEEAPRLLDVASSLVAQLAAFLTALHRFPLARAVERGVPPGSWANWRRSWLDFRAGIERDLASLLLPGERRALSRFWDAFIAELEGAGHPVTLIHHDLGLEHILVAPDGSRLTGVIDWGDVAIGDPAIDFTPFATHYEAAVVEALLREYGREVDAGFTRRAAWYGRCAPFHQFRYGWATGQWEHVEQGLAGIREQTAGFVAG